MNKLSRFLLLSLVLILASVPAFAAANIYIINNDGPGEGFNDPTPVAPVGGNTGTTKGEQRQIAFAHAAEIWAQNIDSNVDIYVVAAFNPLAPNVLGSAGAWDVFSDFAGTPPYPGSAFPQTWYSSALADKLAGYDHDTTSPDLNAQFSSNFNFYLGLDGNHGPLNDLVAVLLHELGHGLGFQNFVSEATGANLGNFFDGPRFYPLQTDVYSQFTYDTTNNMVWSNMTQAQRQQSAVRYGRVVWNGANVTAAAPGVLSFGSPEVRVQSPSSIAGAYQFGTASFGAAIGNPNVTATIVPAADAANAAGPSTTDGCSAFTNAAAVAGRIALIERGTCGFTQKVRMAQDAGAIAAIIYNNAANANAAPPGMATDPVFGPTITIVAASISRADALNIIAAGNVTASIGVDNSILAGADTAGRVRLYMPFPVVSGSSGSHYDTVANRNLLMEPSINGDLTHSLNPPEDLTMPLMRDVGWFADADVDGVENSADNCPNAANGNQANYDGDAQGDVCDADDDNDGVADGSDANPNSNMQPTVTVGACNSGVANVVFPNGLTMMDRIAAITASNRGQFESALSVITNEAKALGLITGAQKGAIHSCN
ncbi:MAG TPA: PA domain-containing protein [Thermoanaerobaculia bacterium]|jgi:hypothetical protein